MNRKSSFLFMFLLALLIVICSCTNNTDEAVSGSIIFEDGVKSLLVAGTQLSQVRPSENELSEEEILMKVAHAVKDQGYYNKKTAYSISPKLENAYIEVPTYIYSLNFSSGSYAIDAVDENGQIIASLNCNSDKNRSSEDFIGCYGPSGEGFYPLTKRAVAEMLENQFPDKEYSEPEMVCLRLAGELYDYSYWYTAVTDKISGETKGFSKTLSEKKDSVVEEYLIAPCINTYSKDNFTSKSLKSISSNPDVRWGGIMKVEQPLGFYKVIEANKTIVDSKTKTAKALTEGSQFAEYRGKGLNSVYSGQPKVSKIEIK